jgi:hypothetical protein
MQHCQDILNFSGSVAQDIIMVHSNIPCFLHLHNSVVEKVMSLIYALALNIHSKDKKKARLKYAASMSEFLNENAFGTPKRPGKYDVLMDAKTGELGEVKFNDGVASKSLELLLVQKVLPHF